jgi:hypothetical protein
MQRIFIATKMSSSSAGFEPANLGSSVVSTLSIDHRGLPDVALLSVKESGTYSYHWDLKSELIL